MLRRGWVEGLLCFASVAALICFAEVALAVTARASATPAASRDISFLLMDALGGRVLEEFNSEALRPAGSFPRLMVLLLGLEQVALGVLSLDEPVAPGPAVAAQSGILLREDERYPFSDLLKAIAVSGAEDATVAVAETIAGSVPAGVELMNARALRLGMTATQFADLGRSALQGDGASSQTSARELGRLARALLDHELVVHWSGLAGLPLKDGAVILRNTNPMVGAVAGVDGLHASAGFGVVATAERGGMRLLAVVLGATAPAQCYATAAELLKRGFAQYERIDVVKEGERVNVPVRIAGGAVAEITPVTEGEFALVRRRGEESLIEVRYQMPGEIAAPVRRDQPIGELIVQQEGRILSVIPLVSPVNVAATGILAAAP